MLPAFHILFLTLIPFAISTLLQKPNNPSRWTVAINPFNSSTRPNVNLHLDFQFSPPIPYTKLLHEWGAHECIWAAIDAAHEHDLDERVPRGGFRVLKEKVRLHAYPMYIDYTWGLLEFTVRQVDAELEARGYFGCTWEVSRMEEGGRLGRIYGRGDMWPIEAGTGGGSGVRTVGAAASRKATG